MPRAGASKADVHDNSTATPGNPFAQIVDLPANVPKTTPRDTSLGPAFAAVLILRRSRAVSEVSDQAQSPLRRVVVELRFALQLRALPHRVAWFHWRARRAAGRARDSFSLASATRPRDLAILISLARGRHRVAELGTATGWTALSLALACPSRRVWSYDPAAHAGIDRYLKLVERDVSSRVELITAAGSSGPPRGLSFDLLYIDSSHQQDETVAEVEAWWPALRPGALVVFDDYEHPRFPGVRAAVDSLGLGGRRLGTLFVHEIDR